ncbi:hypothetical protein BH23PLA1_BH23PLA1_37380 [soil metagenome]
MDTAHLHCYNAGDLWAYLSCLGLEVQGYRVVFSEERPGLFSRLRGLLASYVVTRLLGCDYADNLLMVARRPAKASGDSSSSS